jgi:hypothetical protein
MRAVTDPALLHAVVDDDRPTDWHGLRERP